MTKNYNSEIKQDFPKLETNLKALGFDLVGEDCTNKGRIDLTIKLKKLVSLLAFLYSFSLHYYH